MNSDDLKKGAEVLATVAAAVPLSKALKPAATELGEVLKIPVTLIRAVLRPIELVAKAGNMTFDRLERALQRLLSEVPPDKIVEPPANVAGPLLLAYAFSQEQEPLRAMFEQLLATAMNADTQKSAHPSYVEILRQLSGDEAVIPREMAKRRSGAFPVVRIEWFGQRSFTPKALMSVFDSLCPEDVIISYLENLDRLGLVKLDYNLELAEESGEDLYAVFSEHPDVARLRAMKPPDLREHFRRGSMDLTSFGSRFLRACVDPDFLA